MHVNKIWSKVLQLDSRHRLLMNEVLSHFTQEIIDQDEYLDNGPKSITYSSLIDTMRNDINDGSATLFHYCAVEFCITNEYLIEDEYWNCIDHILKTNSDLSANEKRYLKALNNSYLSIYKISEVKNNNYIILENILEPNIDAITLLDKDLSNMFSEGQLIATRVLALEYKSHPIKYRLSSSLFLLPNKVAQDANEIIITINTAMKKTMQMMSKSQMDDSLDNFNAELMQKKMWSKEILEQWYLYFRDYEKNHNKVDLSGNPLSLCNIEFDIIVNKAKLVKKLDSTPEFKIDMLDDGTHIDSWIWIESNADGSDFSDIKNNDKLDPDTQSYGTIIQNPDTGETYRVFADIVIEESKLIIHLNSNQRANIAEDFMLTNFKGMIDNPVIIDKTFNNPLKNLDQLS